MDNEKKPSEDKSQMNEGSLVDDLRLLFKKHFGSKLIASVNNFKINKKYFTSVKSLFINKRFRKFLIPSVAIGLIVNANLSNKNQVSKKELMWPTDWSEFRTGWEDSEWFQRNQKELIKSNFLKKYPCRLPSALIWNDECKKVKEMRTVIVQNSLKDACIAYGNTKAMANTYLNQLGKNTEEFYKPRRERIRKRIKALQEKGIDGILEWEKAGAYKLDSQDDKNAYKRFEKRQTAFYPTYREWRIKSTSAWFEVLRQAGVKDWKLYSRWSVDGVSDLYWKNGYYSKTKYNTLASGKHLEERESDFNLARQSCIPFVDLEKIDKIVEYDDVTPTFVP